MPNIDINWLAIVVAAAINMAIGALWYSPALFGKQWAKLHGKKVGDMGEGNMGYLVTAVGALIQAWVLVHFVRYAGSITFWKGAITGFWLWVGFVAVVMAGSLIFEGKPWKLWRINAGYYLVVLLINGALLAAWR